jgi:hypothetical protein
MLTTEWIGSKYCEKCDKIGRQFCRKGLDTSHETIGRTNEQRSEEK